jgi:hypothetical protein
MMNGLQRSVGNQATGSILRALTGDPKADEGLTHQPITIEDAVAPERPKTVVVAREPRWARVKAGAVNPIVSPGKVPINSKDLYDEVPGGKAKSTPMFDERRVKYDHVAADGLYIGSGPDPADVMQGSLGDCWDLAVVAAIAARDRGKLMQMMSHRPGAFSATFLRRTTELVWNDGPKIIHPYVPVTVSVAETLLAGPAGSAGKSSLVDSKLRHGPEPLERIAYVESLTGGILTIRVTSRWQLARWAPLLEKAYARFAQEYGQYGGGGENEKKGSGYSDLHGGLSHYVYGAFYGAEAERAERTDTLFKPGINQASLNPAVIAKLLPLQGRADTASKDDHTAPLLTASTNSDLAKIRLKDSLDLFVKSYSFKGLTPDSKGRLLLLQSVLAEWSASTPDRRSFVLVDVERCALDVVREVKTEVPGQPSTTANNGQDLLDERAGTGGWQNTVGSIIDLCLMVGGSQGGQHSIFADHAYTVVSTKLVGDPKTPLAFRYELPNDEHERDKYLGAIDANTSTVRLRNPWSHGGPDVHGDKGNDESGGGYFDVSLNQFLSNVEHVSSLTVERQSEPSP